MSATNLLENGLLSLLFENANYANVGDVTGLRGSSIAGSFYISLHTAFLTETATQTTSEAAYGGYVRQGVARSVAGWTVASGAVTNDGAIPFPSASSGSETEQHFGVGHDVSGSGSLHIWGALSSPLAVSTGITPQFAAGALQVTLD
jgi:hypothetical protein